MQGVYGGEHRSVLADGQFELRMALIVIAPARPVITEIDVIFPPVGGRTANGRPYGSAL